MLAGGSNVLRVRSGLTCVQLWPASVVFHNVFPAKYIVPGFFGEKTIGSVRTTRKSPPRNAFGRISCAWAVRRSKRESLPPKTMSGSCGSGTTYPYSSAATGCHSRNVIEPSLPRLATHAEPLSCCPLHTRYGNALSAFAWYICAVGWLYHE